MEVRVKLYVVLVFLCTLTKSFSQDTTEVVRDYIETDLRNYAFCRCLEHSPDSVALKSFLHDKDGSAAGYFNVLPIGYEEFFMLDSLASAKPREVFYPSKYNSTLTLMKCLDFYNGQELRDSVRAIVERFIIDERNIEELNDKDLYERAISKKNNWK
ncbi:MAG: hypothetical protein U0L74_02875 [Paludibacteraceae bacterium]|nr:hypothetical protein [Paludibacteraceae bacterium]